MEGARRRVKPDRDNEGKALQDCMEKAKVFANDSQISDGIDRQRYTTEEVGRIEFKLYYDGE